MARLPQRLHTTGVCSHSKYCCAAIPRFTDKPERRAGVLGSAFFAAHASFYSGVDWLGAPNAVLTGQAPGGAPVTVVVTLYSPAFSAANASLTYKVGDARAHMEPPGCGRMSERDWR